ncbi:hypothetical protein KCW65_27450, partial [Mycobacterium tuberculosis]|nr:hypothetical protein [Mycobacterium tuberculosis]
MSCGIDLERFSHLQEEDHAPGIGDGDAPRVLFVGRLSAEKHADDIVRAVAKTDPALGLEADIVGGGDQE